MNIFLLLSWLTFWQFAEGIEEAQVSAESIEEAQVGGDLAVSACPGDHAAQASAEDSEEVELTTQSSAVGFLRR